MYVDYDDGDHFGVFCHVCRAMPFLLSENTFNRSADAFYLEVYNILKVKQVLYLQVFHIMHMAKSTTALVSFLA